MNVTLAIPCFNAGGTLAQVLHGVNQLTTPPDELLVVDDGSTDDTADTARRFGARVVQHPSNLGLAAARNTALRQATGEIVVFVDADAVPTPELLARLSDPFGDDPYLAGIGGQLMERAGGQLPDRWRALFWRQTQGERPIAFAPFVVGGCCGLRRAAALQVGGFSLDFRTNGEDVELSLRLRHGGFRLAYDPQARALHLRQDDLRGLLSMVYRHSRDHVRALRTSRESARPVVRAALRWGPVSLYSSLRRHHSPGLAALSPLCYAAALAGCTRGLIGPGPVTRGR